MTENSRGMVSSEMFAYPAVRPTERSPIGFVISETISESDCLALLGREHVGRLGLSIDALPAILPVNYLLLGDSIVLRASRHSELYRASVGAVVAFEADGYDTDAAFGWSVLARGRAVELTDGADIAAVCANWHEAWPLGDHVDRFVVMPIAIVCGWRFTKPAT